MNIFASLFPALLDTAVKANILLGLAGVIASQIGAGVLALGPGGAQAGQKGGQTRRICRDGDLGEGTGL